MENSRYIPRLVDKELEEYLQTFGAVSIEGPKWCGKTRTALEIAKSHIYIDVDEALLEALSVDPYLALRGEVPRLVDEWQIAPSLWDAVRHEVDERAQVGQFILTGSTTPPDEKPRHSGAGRFGFMRMHSLSLCESGESDGVVSLSDLFEGVAETSCISELDLEGLIEALVRGGWPQSIQQQPKHPAHTARSYLKAIEKPERNKKGVPLWDETKMSLFLKTLARNSATSAKISVMTKDVEERSGSMSRTTAYSYLNILKERYVIEEQASWNAYLISKTAMRQAPKRHFADPSLAAAALGASTERLMQDFDTLGRLFESLCFRDCLVYVQSLQGSVYQYHDEKDLEVDMIVALDDGRWGGFEVKLGNTRIDEAAENLLALSRSVDKDRMGEPSFLAVLYGGSVGYMRKDGIQVIPIGCFGP